MGGGGWSRLFSIKANVNKALFGVSGTSHLSVLKRCVRKTLAFAFGLHLRSKTRCFKTRVLGRRLANGKPQERLRFRALRSKRLAFKKLIAIIFCNLKTSLGARACVQVLCVQKNAAFCVCVLKPTKPPIQEFLGSSAQIETRQAQNRNQFPIQHNFCMSPPPKMAFFDQTFDKHLIPTSIKVLLHEIITRSLIHATPKFAFLKLVPNSAQHPVCVCVYIYTYRYRYLSMYIFGCEVIIWAKFGVLKGYYLGQVCFRIIKIGVSGDFFAQLSFCVFCMSSYLPIF